MKLFHPKTIKPLMYVSIAVLIIALLVGTWRPKTREGYKMMPELENPISKSDLYVVLTECVNNILAHETVLSTLDPGYKADTVSVDVKKSDMENIQNLLKIIKKQDIQIHKMLPNYLMNQDLDGLINGTLLAEGAKFLEQKSKYPENPMDCDPEAILRAINDYKTILKSLDCGDDKNKSKCMSYDSSIIQLESKLIELRASKPAPGNNKCLPPLMPWEAEGIMDGRYANALAKIIKSQDLAVESIKAKAQSEIANFYSIPIVTGSPPPNPLADVM